MGLCKTSDLRTVQSNGIQRAQKRNTFSRMTCGVQAALLPIGGQKKRGYWEIASVELVPAAGIELATP